MAAPSGVTWDLLPHTAAKHAILHQYLGAWFPILGIGTARELYYFDGFAGPGEYTRGEVGSPLIALDAASQVASKLPSAVHFVFSELEAPVPNIFLSYSQLGAILPISRSMSGLRFLLRRS